jgi:hypothetical protein
MYIKGNTKGIHIYIKINNMVSYTNQQKVFINIDGDLMKKTNMWEGVDKEILNYDGEFKTYEYNEIKHIFNEKINLEIKQPKIVKAKEQPKEETKKIIIEKVVEGVVEKVDEKKDETKDIEIYLTLGLKYDMFKKMSENEKTNSRTTWINLGYIIKNELGIDGIDWFIKVSEHDPNFNEEKVKATYICLNDTLKYESKTKDKKPLGLGTLIKYFKEVDETKYNKMRIEFYQKKNGTLEEYTKRFDIAYFHTLKTYNDKKTYFEMFVCKILRPSPMFIYGEIDGESYNCLLYKEDDIIKTFKPLRHYKVVNEEGDMKEVSFISDWLEDPKILYYNRMDFMPYNGTRNLKEKPTSKEVFNLFNGYNPKILSPFDESKKDKILKPFFDLVLEICGGVKEHCEYFLNFIAQIVQHPNDKIPICFIFKSKQGIGKNVMLDAIGRIMGQGHYISSSNPKDFFSDYAEGFYRKLIVNLNECEGKDTFDFEGKIKSFITESKITINPKHIKPTEIDNHARAIIFTNKPNPIPIDVKSKDRRFVVYQGTEVYLDDKYGKIFWGKLVDHFKRDDFISCLYDNLNKRDLTDFKKTKRPITNAYLEMCKQYVPVECVFMEKYIDEHKNQIIGSFLDAGTLNEQKEETVSIYEDLHTVSTTDLYKCYIDFCKKYGFTNDKQMMPNIRKFSDKLIELDMLITRKKTSETTVFTFTMKEVYELMIKKNWIVRAEDENAIDIELMGDAKEEEFNDYFNI